MTPTKAIELWQLHLLSIRQAFNVFGEYVLPSTGISHVVLEDLEDGLAVLAQIVAEAGTETSAEAEPGSEDQDGEEA